MTRPSTARRAAAALAALLSLLLVAACGGTVGDPGAQSAAPEPSAITVETARGPIGLPGPAMRVVSLEWVYTEELMSLGVVPVGVADTEGYREWLGAPGTDLPPTVPDLGTRNSPSLEQITALAPDLIVTAEDRVGANYDALARIAPVLSFDYTRAPQIETMKQDFLGLAAAVGRTDRANEVLGELDAATADLRTRVEAAGRTGAPYAITQGYTTQGAPTMRMFTDQAATAQVLNAAGLRNTWNGQPDSYGMTIIGVEGLGQVDPAAQFLYVAVPSDDPFTGALATNPAWQNLPFVAENRVTGLDPRSWQFGGPASKMKLLDEVGKAFGV